MCFDIWPAVLVPETKFDGGGGGGEQILATNSAGLLISSLLQPKVQSAMILLSWYVYNCLHMDISVFNLGLF